MRLCNQTSSILIKTIPPPIFAIFQTQPLSSFLHTFSFDEQTRDTLERNKPLITNNIIYSIKPERSRNLNKEQSDVGVLTKHSFILMMVTQNGLWQTWGDGLAAYFSIAAFRAAFKPFLLCFLAKRIFLRNLGSTCNKVNK